MAKRATEPATSSVAKSVAFAKRAAEPSAPPAKALALVGRQPVDEGAAAEPPLAMAKRATEPATSSVAKSVALATRAPEGPPAAKPSVTANSAKPTAPKAPPARASSTSAVDWAELKAKWSSLSRSWSEPASTAPLSLPRIVLTGGGMALDVLPTAQAPAPDAAPTQQPAPPKEAAPAPVGHSAAATKAMPSMPAVAKGASTETGRTLAIAPSPPAAVPAVKVAPEPVLTAPASKAVPKGAALEALRSPLAPIEAGVKSEAASLVPPEQAGEVFAALEGTEELADAFKSLLDSIEDAKGSLQDLAKNGPKLKPRQEAPVPPKVDDSLELACEPEKQVSFEKQERSDATAVEAAAQLPGRDEELEKITSEALALSRETLLASSAGFQLEDVPAGSVEDASSASDDLPIFGSALPRGPELEESPFRLSQQSPPSFGGSPLAPAEDSEGSDDLLQ